MTIHTFIISWCGQHENAERIVREVASASDFLSVVYSDPDANSIPLFSCSAIRRPDELFFGDKFQACLDSFDADLLLVICADCTCDRWPEVPEHCKRAIEEIPNIGVWAPRIDFTDWHLERTEIHRIPNSPFSIVAQTDSIVFGLTSAIVNRLRQVDLRKNVYGWGIDSMFNYFAYSIGRISVVDRNLLVKHPGRSRYSIEVAASYQIEFLKQLTAAERAQSDLLDAIVHLHDKINVTSTEDLTVSDTKHELALLSETILRAQNCAKRPMLSRVSRTIVKSTVIFFKSCAARFAL